MAQLVLLGAGHAHLETLLAIPKYRANGHQVTVISPDRWLYYSGMAPCFFGGGCDIDMVNIDVETMSVRRGAHFERAECVSIDREERTLRLSNGKRCRYDILSCNIGSVSPLEGAISVDREAIGKSIFPAKPVKYIIDAREAILSAMTTRDKLIISIAGGGAAGCEIAGNTLRIVADETARRKCAVTVNLFCANRPLAGHPERFRRRVIETLARGGVNLCVGSRALAFRAGSIELDTGEFRRCDIAFIAAGVKPPPLFSSAGLVVDADGALRTNKFLQSESDERIFGGGDCIAFSPRALDKVGVYAIRQNVVLARNLGTMSRKIDLRAAGPKRDTRLGVDGLRAFHPQRGYFFALNLGGGYGAGTKWGFAIDPKMALRFKERFDRQFVLHYRAKERDGESIVGHSEITR